MPTKADLRQLQSLIDELEVLLQNLPKSIPYNASAYPFDLDLELEEEEGKWCALNKCIENTFDTLGRDEENKIDIQYRSPGFSTLIWHLREVLDKEPSEAAVLENRVHQLMKGARKAGAQEPGEERKRKLADHPPERKHKQKKHASTFIELSDSESEGEVIEIDQEPESTAAANAHSSLSLPKSILPPPTKKPAKLVQKQLSFKPATEDDKKRMKEAEKRREEAFNQQLEAEREREEERQLGMKERGKEQGARRQREYRAREKEKKERQKEEDERNGKEDGRNKPGQTFRVHDTSQSNVDVAAVSREKTNKWKASRNGKRGGQNLRDATTQRTNWYHPYLIVLIQTSAGIEGYKSAQAIVSRLQRQRPELFATLSRQVIHRWINDDKTGWSISTLDNIAMGRSTCGGGRVGILQSEPELVEEVKKVVKELRMHGVVVNVSVTRSIIIATIKEAGKEHLLTGRFTVSETYVRYFLGSTMGMSPRVGTQAAAKLPDDWKESCTRLFYRLVNFVALRGVPAELIINMDQTGVLLVPGHRRTYEVTGSKQVLLHGMDEKRGYTLCVTSTSAGQLLPFQQIFGGQTEKVLPSSSAPGMADARKFGFHTTFAQSIKNKQAHYSTQKTMAEFLEAVIKPHYYKTCKSKNLKPGEQMMVLLLDVYAVHRSKEFRELVATKYPFIQLMYIPAGCTGKFQPADVGLQRPLKHYLRQFATQQLVDMHRARMKDGGALCKANFKNTLNALRDASILPLVNLYQFMNSKKGKELVQMAWRKCEVGEWNLGYATTTSPDAKNSLWTYLQADSVLRGEVSQYVDVPEPPKEFEEEFNYEDNGDDTSVPLSAVIKDILDIFVTSPDYMNIMHCADASTIENSGERGFSGLYPNVEEENIPGQALAALGANPHISAFHERK